MLEWVLLKLLTVALLILATAFFVAAEFAMVSVRETRLEQLQRGNRVGANAALRLKREIDDFLAANQLGVTLCSLALGWVGESALADLLERGIHSSAVLHALPLLQQHASAVAHGISVTAAFGLITFFEVVLGEQVPKSLALQRGERIAIAVAGPMEVFIRVSRPAVYLLKISTALVLRLFRAPLKSETSEIHSPEEIRLVAAASRESGLLPEFQEQLIQRAIDLGHVTVREIMIPRGRIFCLPADMPVEVASARIVEEQHSRVPVFDPSQGPEHIVGIVYSKDISRLMHYRREHRLPSAYGNSPVQLRSIMRDAMVVPETKLAAELLQEFQERRRQMAIVVDEFGSTVGLATAEDALEQLVGEIEDEFDLAAKGVPTDASGIVDLEGTVTVRDLTTELKWQFPREPGVETLAGFMLAQLGHIPQKGEAVVYDGRRFTALELAGRRISRIRVEPVAATKAIASGTEQAAETR